MTPELEPGWALALESVLSQRERAWAAVAAERASGYPVLPADCLIERAFQVPFDRVRVVILGQDPYPNPAHACGLAFSVPAGVRPWPGSLRNIITEWCADLSRPMPATADLAGWLDEGVLLLNTALTVRAGQVGSHAELGWRPVIETALGQLARRGGPLVALLWGKQAASVAGVLDGVPQLHSAHPSPLSAGRGFFGSRPFSRANQALLAQGGAALEWTLDHEKGL